MIHVPKLSLCLSCRHRNGDCTKLNFMTMPVVATRACVAFVACTSHQPKTESQAMEYMAKILSSR